jgi:hypothetical protein
MAAIVLSAGCSDAATGPTLAAPPSFVSGIASRHFNGADATVSSTGDLLISFKVVGRRSDSDLDVTATAEAAVWYGCVEDGAVVPEPVPSGTISSTSLFGADSKGKIAGSLTLNKPTPPLLLCADGYHALLFVRYTNVVLTSSVAGTEAVTGTFDAIF